MDIRDILKSFDQLTEGDSTVHKAGPGGYGNRHGTDDVTDQYGKPIGQMSLGKLGAQNEPKRGKGRPPNPDKPKSYDSSALGKAMGMGKAPKPTGKPSVKHSLKEYFDQMDDALSEAGITVKPMQGASQIIGADGKPMGTADMATANVIKAASEKGTLKLGGDEQMEEGGDVGKHNNATTGFDALVRKLTPKYGKEAATKIAGSQFQKMKEEDQSASDVFAKARNDKRHADDEMFAASKFGNKQAATDTFAKARNAKRNADDEMYAVRKGVAEADELRARGGLAAINKNPRPGQTDLRNIPAGNYPGSQNKFTDKDREEHPANLKAKIRATLGKHTRSNLPEQGVAEAEAPQYFAQSSPLSSNNRGVLESKKGVNPFAKKEETDKKKCPPMSHIKKMCQDGKSVAEICKMHPDCDQKELKQMVADCKKKLSEAKMPDTNNNNIPDYAEDGKGPNDTKKKGAAPKKGVNPFAKKTEKKKVKEGMEHHLQAARLEGKSHALRKMPYNCTHDDMEESRCYHDGFKEGLDECYGQMPILGRTSVGEMGQGPEVATMASYGADDMGEAMYDEGADELGEMDKTSYMKQQAQKPGNTFKAFGQTFRDSDVLDEFAFEALDKQLNAILEDKKVSEGMTVSISKGQQGSPDSVSVSAQDGEADQLLSIIKSAGLGLFGGNEQNGYGAPQGSTAAPGGIEVVDDHDGMMSLMKKLSGGGEVQGGGDYEDEEGHMHGEEETCESCGGMMEENHQCESDEQSVMGEDESEDQMAYEVAEANAPDSGADNTNADVAGNAAANSALATADAGADEEEGQVYSSPTEGMEDTTGEEAGTDALDEEGYYKDPDGDEDSAEDKADKADHERRSREEETVAESFANLYKKLAYLSEESTSEKDAKAEKAGKKVAKDIEYDEGDKGKDDNKAEKAGKKVTKDIEYDDKKDKKVDESYANSADDTFEADIDFMTKVITGGLNRQKSTGQTTIPVIAGQRNRMGADGLGSPMKESTDLLKDYMKLSGL